MRPGCLGAADQGGREKGRPINQTRVKSQKNVDPAMEPPSEILTQRRTNTESLAATMRPDMEAPPGKQLLRLDRNNFGLLSPNDFTRRSSCHMEEV